MSRYTVEELSALTGYSVGTIQDLTCRGLLPSPIRGLNATNLKKGLYVEETLDLLNHYKHLVAFGRSKEWVNLRMFERMVELCQ
jgi:hypothetical protein